MFNTLRTKPKVIPSGLQFLIHEKVQDIIFDVVSSAATFCLINLVLS